MATKQDLITAKRVLEADKSRAATSDIIDFIKYNLYPSQNVETILLRTPPFLEATAYLNSVARLTLPSDASIALIHQANAGKTAIQQANVSIRLVSRLNEKAPSWLKDLLQIINSGNSPEQCKNIFEDILALVKEINAEAIKAAKQFDRWALFANSFYVFITKAVATNTSMENLNIIEESNKLGIDLEKKVQQEKLKFDGLKDGFLKYIGSLPEGQKPTSDKVTNFEYIPKDILLNNLTLRFDLDETNEASIRSAVNKIKLNREVYDQASNKLKLFAADTGIKLKEAQADRKQIEGFSSKEVHITLTYRAYVSVGTYIIESRKAFLTVISLLSKTEGIINTLIAPYLYSLRTDAEKLGTKGQYYEVFIKDYVYRQLLDLFANFRLQSEQANLYISFLSKYTIPDLPFDDTMVNRADIRKVMMNAEAEVSRIVGNDQRKIFEKIVGQQQSNEKVYQALPPALR